MADDETRQCPFCKEQIHSDATKCKYCGSRVEPARPQHGGQSSLALAGAGRARLRSIEAAVNAGEAVVSADNSIIIDMMQEALKNGRTATFYVSPAQAQAVMQWHWTPRRIKEWGMEPISKEERARIESELGLKAPAGFSNYIRCQCGGVYGAFEFMQQGLREHGRDFVEAVLDLKNTAVLRINPSQDAICSNCNQKIVVNHAYDMYTDDGKPLYGCCSSDSY